MPGIAGTYGVAGWGGRPSHGDDWLVGSRRLLEDAYRQAIRSPVLTPVGNYVYHADMAGQLRGRAHLDSELGAPRATAAILHRNRWYCVKQYLRMNTPAKNDA